MTHGKAPFHVLLSQLAQEHEFLQQRYNELLRQNLALRNSAATVGLDGGPCSGTEADSRTATHATVESALPSPHWRAPPAPPPRPNPTTSSYVPPQRSGPGSVAVPAAHAASTGSARPSSTATMDADLNSSWREFFTSSDPYDDDFGDRLGAASEARNRHMAEEDLEVPPSSAAKRAQSAWLRFFLGLSSQKQKPDIMTQQVGPKSADSASGLVLSAKDALPMWPEWESTLASRPQSVKMVDSCDDCTDIAGVISRKHVKETVDNSRCQRFVIKPNCYRKLAWDLLGLAWLSWDFLTIPLTVFDIKDNMVFQTVAMSSSVFWNLDLILNFFVGFYDRGQTELRPIKVWTRYLKSWFLPDLLLVCVDWLIVVLQHHDHQLDVAGFARIGRSWRIIRALRMLRLLRMVKLSKLFDEFTDLIRSDASLTMIGISKLLCGIAMINHMIACAWYGVGTLGHDEDTWLVPFGGTNGFERSTIETVYVYVTALHWSLTQFTPASMEVVPRNVYERLFAISIILLALIVFSSFVSSITASMTHLRNIKLKQTKLQSDIRKYIVDNGISSDLALQIHAFAKMHHVRSRRVLMSDLTFVKFMPENMRIRLHWEVFLHRLNIHPLFERFSMLDQAGVIKICHTAMSEKTSLAGEELFNYGDPCSQMYFPLCGDLRYYHHSLNGDAEFDFSGSETEQWRISELVLWIPWEHRGKVVASTSSFFMTLSSAKFRRIARDRPVMAEPARLYARGYVREALRASGGMKEFLLDVWDEGHCLDGVAQEAFMELGVESPVEECVGKPMRIFRTMSSSMSALRHTLLRPFTW